MKGQRICQLVLISAAMLLGAGIASAKSIKVSSGGIDSPTCGSGANPPCATLTQAVDNAANGDSILVGPGRYSGVSVGKSVKLWSSGGTGGAVIVGEVVLEADNIVFGKLGKGFGVSPASGGTALQVTANGVTVRGNAFSDCNIGVDAVGNDVVVRDNSFNQCATAIRVAGARAQVRGNRSGYTGAAGVELLSTSSGADIRENRTFGPSGTAVIINGSDHLVRRNYVHGTPGGGFTVVGSPANVHLLQNLVISSSGPGYNLTGGSGWTLTGNAAIDCNAPGFYITAGATITAIGNVAIGNSTIGILIANGSDHVLVNNSAIDNVGDGLILSAVGGGVQVSGGNLYGNTSGCGFNNSSGSAVSPDGVYWGHPSGPGPDPADIVCGNIPAVTVTNPASKPAVIKLPGVK